MNSLTPYQFIAPLFSLTMVVYAWNLVRRQKKTIWEGMLWTVFWAAVGYVSVFPASLQYLSDLTGIKKNENAALVTAIGILFFSLFYMVIRVEELEHKLVRLVQDRALKDARVEERSDSTEKC